MRNFTLLIPLMVLASAGVVAAQTDLQRFERQLEQIRRDTRIQPSSTVPVDQRTYFEFGAFTTVNYISFDDPSLENRTLWQYDLVAYAQMNLDGIHDVFVRGRAFYRDFGAGDEFDEDDEGWDGRLDRGYYRFDVARYLESSKGQQTTAQFSIKGGRDLIFWANGLTFSTEMDGVVIDLGTGPYSLQVLAGITPRDTVDIDASRPDFDDDTKRTFYGAMLSMQQGTHRPFVYFLGQQDRNDSPQDVQLDDDTVVPTKFDYNSYYFGLGSSGALTDRIVYGVEFAYEIGNTQSSSIDSTGATIPQVRDNIHAWALDAQIDYLFPDLRRTRVGGELILASGDDDRLSTTSTFGGNSPGTKDHAFNAFGLLNTGLAFAPAVSNLVVLRGGASTYPFPDIRVLNRMQIGMDLFLFGKFDKNAPIDEKTTDDFFLGFEPDIYLNWQISSDVSLALRYGAFIPGDAIENDDRIRQFIYAGVTFAF